MSTSLERVSVWGRRKTRIAERAAEARVDQGEAWLDAHVPHWWHEGYINVQTLAMQNGMYCVWGQLAARNLEEWFGPLLDRTGTREYADCVAYLRDYYDVEDDDDGEGNAWMQAHGFELPDHDPEYVTYGLLTDVWVVRIHARRYPDDPQD